MREGWGKEGVKERGMEGKRGRKRKEEERGMEERGS